MTKYIEKQAVIPTGDIRTVTCALSDDEKFSMYRYSVSYGYILEHMFEFRDIRFRIQVIVEDQGDHEIWNWSSFPAQDGHDQRNMLTETERKAAVKFVKRALDEWPERGGKRRIVK